MIRPATNADLPHIVELETLLFPDNALSPLMLEREAAVSRVLVIGEPVYAYAIVGGDGHLLDLLRLGVHPERQGEGAGARLLEHVLGLGQGVVLTVRKNNHRALRLYRKHGFGVVGHVSEAGAWVLYREAACTGGPSSSPCG